MKIVDLDSKDEQIWETPFDEKLQQIFTHSHFNYDKTALVSAFPHLEELISLPEKIKLLVQVASYTNTDGYFCDNPRQIAIDCDHISPHLYQIKGYLLKIGFPPIREGFPMPLNVMIQQVGSEEGNNFFDVDIYSPSTIKDPNAYLKYGSVEEREKNHQVVQECLWWHPVRISLIDSGKVLYHNNVLEEQMERLEKEMEKRRGNS
jgi:hypothetical protein